MLIYPEPLKKGDLIAITASSSGVEKHLHPLLKKSKSYIEKLGYTVIEGETIWTNDKCVSNKKEKRAEELQNFLLDDKVKAIIPPWGGEFLMEILPLMDWELLKTKKPKWILGYSDTSTFLFVYTLLTGYATTHGTNYIDLGMDSLDETTARWHDVLRTAKNEIVEQVSSKKYQSAWDFSKPYLNLNTPTNWIILGKENSNEEVHFSGRLIGGCLDTLSILVGTPFASVQEFSKRFCEDTGMIWYLESCDMTAAEIYRSLWQMKQCGWFENTNGVLFGRPAGYGPSKNFECEDAYHRIFDELDIPIVYDVDIGHVPPQLTLVNGAFAKVSSSAGKGKVVMTFC